MLYYINPLTWFRWTTQFVFAWISSIRWRGSLAAVPALLVFVSMGVGTALALSQSSTWRGNLIDRQLADAQRQSEHEILELLLKRRLRTEPNNRLMLYTLADVRDKLERRDEAIVLFRRLVEEYEDGRAAVWLISNDVNPTKITEWNEEVLKDYGDLTELAVRQYPDSVELNLARADYFHRTGQHGNAIPHLWKTFNAQPMQGLNIAVIHRALGEEEKADDVAKDTQERIEELILAKPQAPEYRVALAKVLVFREQYDEAVNALVNGFRTTGDERLKGLVGDTLVLYANSIRNKDETTSVDDQRRSLILLQKAVKVAPGNPLVIKAVSDTILDVRSKKASDPELQALTDNLLDSLAPDFAHFVRGTVAMLENKPEIAANELTLAAQSMPQAAAILNNLAVANAALAQQNNEPQKLDDALDMVTKALELIEAKKTDPNQLPYFLETRGQIYLAQGKHLEAITDLESALRVPALQLKAHQGLAQAYRAIGQEADAERHQSRAEEMLAAQNASTETTEARARAEAIRRRVQGDATTGEQAASDDEKKNEDSK